MQDAAAGGGRDALRLPMLVLPSCLGRSGLRAPVAAEASLGWTTYAAGVKGDKVVGFPAGQHYSRWRARGRLVAAGVRRPDPGVASRCKKSHRVIRVATAASTTLVARRSVAPAVGSRHP